MSLETNLEGDPRVRRGHPGALTGSCVQQEQLPECFSTNPASSEAYGWGTGTCSLGSFSGHLALTPPHPLTLPPPPHPHISNNDRCEKTEQGSEEPGLRAQHTIRIRDQTEIQSVCLSVASVRAQSAT